MQIVFETARLRVRQADEGDARFLFELWTNPEVMKFVGFPQGLRIGLEQVERQIREQGSSPFDVVLMVERKQDGVVIGQCKLGSSNEGGVAHTDVKLSPEFWGNRYGVEIKQGLLDYLFTHTDCVAVEATPNVNNLASIGMQEAVGGERVGEGVFEFPPEMRDYTTPVPHLVYQVSRACWEQRRARTQTPK